MLLRFGALLAGVGVFLVGQEAWAFSCPLVYRIPNPAPPDVAVVVIESCCTGELLSATSRFVPLLDAEDPERPLDPSRSTVEVVFSEFEDGVALGRAVEELAAGAWRHEQLDDWGEPVDYLGTTFVVDPRLAGTIPTAQLGGTESFSEFGNDGQAEQPYAYVHFDIDFDSVAIAVEVYAVTEGERAEEPLVVGASSYDDGFDVGQKWDDCEGRFEVEPDATYDVRVAALLPNGERGEWSEFTRATVPALPQRAFGCSLSPRATSAAGFSWSLFVGALGALLLGRRRAR